MQGTRCIQGIALDFKKRSTIVGKKYNEVILDTKSFEPMVTLRLLQINNLSLEGKFLPDELKWLQWQGCPLECIPLDTLPRELTVLDLSNAEKIKSLRELESREVYVLGILCIVLITNAQTSVIAFATLFTIFFC